MISRCAECGFDPTSVSPEAAAASVRAFAVRYRTPLTRFLDGEDGATLLRTRPADGRWSAIEYAAHVRDVFALFDRRIGQIVAVDHPALEIVDHDRAVGEGRYQALEAAVVADEITVTAERLAARLESLGPSDWNRTGTRAGEERSTLEIARRAVHEGSHHLLDIGRALRAARGR